MRTPHGHSTPYPVPSPGKHGYRWSVGLAVAAVLLFTAVYLFAVNRSLPGPDIVERLDSGERVTFDVADGEDGDWAAYHSSPGLPDSISCTLYSPGGEVTYPSAGGMPPDQTFGEWGAVGVLETPDPGTYTLACSGSSEEYAIGGSGPLGMVDVVYWVVHITVLGVVPLLLIGAVVVGVVTALRRGSARKSAPALQDAAPNAPDAPRYPHPPNHPHQG